MSLPPPPESRIYKLDWACTVQMLPDGIVQEGSTLESGVKDGDRFFLIEMIQPKECPVVGSRIELLIQREKQEENARPNFRISGTVDRGFYLGAGSDGVLISIRMQRMQRY